MRTVYLLLHNYPFRLVYKGVGWRASEQENHSFGRHEGKSFILPNQSRMLLNLIAFKKGSLILVAVLCGLVMMTTTSTSPEEVDKDVEVPMAEDSDDEAQVEDDVTGVEMLHETVRSAEMDNEENEEKTVVKREIENDDDERLLDAVADDSIQELVFGNLAPKKRALIIRAFSKFQIPIAQDSFT